MGKTVENKAPENEPSDYLPYDSEKQWWTCDPKGVHSLQDAKTGPASYTEGVPLKSIPHLFAEAVKANGNKLALAVEEVPLPKKGEKPPPALPLKQWKTWTYKEYLSDVRKFAKACIAVGMEAHDSVNIFGFNSPQWGISLFGAMFAGGKGAGIYPSDNEDQVQYKSDHSNGVVAVLEDLEHLAKFKSSADKLPMLRAIVCWGCDAGEDFTTAAGVTIKTFTFDEFLALGEKQAEGDLERRLAHINPGQAACLVYTSGTTGRPKAVMLCHDTLHFAATTAFRQTNVVGVKKTDERVLSYLPLSHVAGMMVDLVAPLALTSNLSLKGSVGVYFARPYDLKYGTLVDRLTSVRPTVFLGVPRVWEKIMEKLKAVGASSSGVMKSVSAFAKKRGALYTSSRQMGESKKNPKSMKVVNIVLNKIKTKLGLNHAKFMFSGAAPMSKECLEFFGSLGINVNEVYGMSETAGLVTWSTDDHHLWGSVGFEVGGVEVKCLDIATRKPVHDSTDIFHCTEEQQGEICFRGRNIMMGYMANDRMGKEHVVEIEEKNKDAIDENGWMHSGDKGTRGTNGMFKITGRYKELIIGAGGENIAPVPIEDEVKRLCPIISNIIMIGNKRKYNIMLVTLKTVGATGEFPGSDKLDGEAAKLSSTSKTLHQAMDDPVFAKAIEEAIMATNKNEEVVPSNAAKVQKFSILPRDFSVQTGELTATLKLKRNVVEEEFEPIISKMFEVKSNYVNYKLAPTEDLDMGNAVLARADSKLDGPFAKDMTFNVDEAVDEAEGEVEDTSKTSKTGTENEN